MQESTSKIWCKTIYLADTPLDIFILPDGECYLSQAQVLQVTAQDDGSDLEALEQNSIRPGSNSKYFKALSNNGFKLDLSSEKLSLREVDKPINPVSLDVACLYWHKSAMAGNEKAQKLIVAMMNRTVYRLADEAFDTTQN